MDAGSFSQRYFHDDIWWKTGMFKFIAPITVMVGELRWRLAVAPARPEWEENGKRNIRESRHGMDDGNS